MGLIKDHWEAEESRIEDGIFFPDDTYVPLGRTGPTGPRVPIAALIDASPNGWGAIYPGRAFCVSHGLSLFGGATSWEGAGFLAVLDNRTRQLLWLLHSSQSEPFSDAAIDGDTIIAHSEGYPRRVRWRIPVADPARLQRIDD